jgi:hypothetical protein
MRGLPYSLYAKCGLAKQWKLSHDICAGGFLDAGTAADLLTTLSANSTYGGLGYWSVGHDFNNKLPAGTGQTWSQRVLRALGDRSWQFCGRP